MKSRNPSVSANAEPAPLAGEPERVIPSRSRPEGKPQKGAVRKVPSLTQQSVPLGTGKKVKKKRLQPVEVAAVVVGVLIFCRKVIHSLDG